MYIYLIDHYFLVIVQLILLVHHLQLVIYHFNYQLLLVHHLQIVIYNYQQSITPIQPYTDIYQVIALNNENMVATDDLLLIHEVDIH